MPAFPSSSTVSRWRRWAWRLGVGAGLIVAIGGLVLGLYLADLASELPEPALGPEAQTPLTTVIYSAQGTELARYYRENRTWIDHDAIAPVVTRALIATEDHRFYDHGGVDLLRLVKAAYETVRGDRQGASTITMQLARNTYPSIADAPMWTRKAKELLMARRLERRYSKAELLEAYLNTVPFGYQAFGIEAAAGTYFGATAGSLTPPQAALLIGLLKGPSHYHPVRHPDRARQRRNLVLHQMHRRGFLRADACHQHRAAPLGLNVQRTSLADRPAPHFAEHVRRWLDDWAAAHGYDPLTDGLRVHTTLDDRLQQMAQHAVDQQMADLQAVAAYEWSRPNPSVLRRDPSAYPEADSADAFGEWWRTHPEVLTTRLRQTHRYRRLRQRGLSADSALTRLRANTAFIDSLKAAHTRLEAGFVALDPRTGAVKAWIGGRDFERDQYDKVALARRQPGSTFKPFVYAAAAEAGYAPYDTARTRTADWERLRPGWVPPSESARNATTLRGGLVRSSNEMALHLARELGPRRIAQMARRLGIGSALRPVPSLALGTSEVSLLEMAGAYSTLAAQGTRRPPRFISHITDASGRRIATFAPQSKRVLSRHIAYTVLDMMRGVVDRGTAWPLRHTFGIDADVAAKTGTTQDGADGWFLMMHPRLVTGAWVGFNDRRLSFRTDYWEAGSHNALRLAGDFFRRALKAHPEWTDRRFARPAGYAPPAPPDLRRTSAPAAPDTTDPLIRRALDPEAALRSQRAVSPPDRSASPTDALSRRSADPEAALRDAIAVPSDSADADASERNSP